MSHVANELLNDCLFYVEFKRKLFHLLETQNYNLKVVMKDITCIKNLLASFQNVGSSNHSVPRAEVTFNLPCTTEAELQALEADIADEHQFDALVSMFLCHCDEVVIKQMCIMPNLTHKCSLILTDLVLYIINW